MEAYLGQISMFGCNYAPRGWEQCNGQMLAISQNTALFSLLRTAFGGDGRTTYALPDMRGRSPVGIGMGPGLSDVVWGEKMGNEMASLTEANLASHTHTAAVKASDVVGAEIGPKGHYLAKAEVSGGGSGVKCYGPVADVTMASDAVTINNTGGNRPFGIRSPGLGINFCICISGNFPSQN